MIEQTSQSVDQFLSPSRFTARMHADRGFLKTVVPLPYFLDPVDEDWRNPGPRPQERPYFLFVGRLEFIKGLQTLIPLWNGITQFDLLIAGAGTYGEQLRALAGSNPRVRFLGPLSQSQLGSLYYHAQGVLVPSITYETFGVIIIEAFARKTPVIVRDLGALPEVVNDSGGGFTYQTDEQLLEYIQQIGGSRGLRDELGAKGYTAFLKLWTKEAHLDMYFDIIRRAGIRRSGREPWSDGIHPGVSDETTSEGRSSLSRG
jgi:glycosyltransferase involved in cell wall biosynthesis